MAVVALTFRHGKYETITIGVTKSLRIALASALIATSARVIDTQAQSTSALGVGPPPPTLEAVVDTAFSRHPQQQAMAAREGEVKALHARASSLIADNPSLGGLYKSDKLGSRDGFREWEAGVYLPLWKPGQRTTAKRLVDSTARALQEGFHALKLSVAGEVRERMWEVALRQNVLELAKKEWDTAQSLERDVNRRVELGELARTDLLLARDTTLSKHSAYLEAQREREHAQQDYESYTGLRRLPRRRDEMKSALSTITADHPRLAEATAHISATQASLAAARYRGAGTPELFLGGNGERDRSGGDFNTRLVVSLTLPIGTKAHTATSISMAERNLAEARAAYDLLHRELTGALVQANRSLQTLQTELELAEARNRTAEENLRLARIAFNLGETDLIGLLRMQGLAFAAERQQKELRIMRQRAVARYNQAAGVLP